jgi:subtilase family serine protease
VFLVGDIKARFDSVVSPRMNILNLLRRARPSAHTRSRSRRCKCAQPTCEQLEYRELLTAGVVNPSLDKINARPALEVLAQSSTLPAGLTPQEIRTAYGVDKITFSSGNVSGNGAGQTIAIVDAYNDPNIASDLAAFDAEYGLASPPSFTVVNLGGATTDPGWALETALDVEWAHAVAPAANIVLVEAASASLSGLFSAVSFAGKLPGVSVVSMSWGTPEFLGESTYDSVFTTPAGHANVTDVAASGDSGAWSGPMYPSVSPNVLAVGGTTLTVTAGGVYSSETGWSGSTGGFSGTDSNFFSFETEPSYQVAALQAAGLSYGVRTTPDVSWNADPSTGVAAYDSVSYGGQSGWFQLGGTSAAAPAWAALVAIADQGLATGGKGPLSTAQVLTDLYSLPSSDFHDITSGSNGYSATTGYDLVTGLGTPRADAVVAGVLADHGVSESQTAGASSISSTTTSSRSSVTGTSGSSTSSSSSSSSSSSQHVSHAKRHHARSHKTSSHKKHVANATARKAPATIGSAQLDRFSS